MIFSFFPFNNLILQLKIRTKKVLAKIKHKKFELVIIEAQKLYNKINIKDPWGYGIAVYRMCAAEIEKCLELLIKELEKRRNM